ncbi:MAG: Rpn family recombination-promoting nuclease/putative transposase [Oscillatoriales cyanobacterium SM2_1_8]|nr:Rpn family recombination-promoting nuclease/putative transposase [Oscillatoriales cyanobacterium SM2_1_8]
MFDNTCKYLAATYPEDMAAWLLGKPQPLVEVSPQELALDPIRADSLVLLRGANLLLHLEFQTQPDGDMPLRMLDYWLRLRRKFPDTAIRQMVLYLRPTTSAQVFANRFCEENTEHRYEVVRLWEREPQELLGRVGTLPLAILAGQGEKTSLLREVAAAIAGLPDGKMRGEVATSTYILAGLVMGDNAIEGILRRDGMRESVTYQKILAEGMEKGIHRGRQAGKQEGEAQLVWRLLTRRCGNLPASYQGAIARLSLTELEDLGEALLDWQSPADLEAWLTDRGAQP